MNRAIVLNVQITARPGQGLELVKHFLALLESSRQEPGCLNYILHTDPTDQHRIMLYESFKDQAALDQHAAAPHHQAFLRWRESQSPDPVASAIVTRWEPVA
jgi:quinol monooxygenase YgiN